MKKILLICILCLLTVCPAEAQNLKAKVNRTAVPEGETFMLTLESEGPSGQDSPDFSVLDRDFTIYSISNAYTTNIINNQVEQLRQWNLVLMPKRNGEIMIPAIKLGKVASLPLLVKVIKSGEEISSQNANSTDAPLYKISGKVDNTQPFVQQQINYTLTITDSGGLQGEEPVFMTSGDDWIIRNLGQPQITTNIINGRTQREIKFNYALFPQKSGELTVPEVKFNGFYLTKNSRNDPFQEIFGNDLFVAGFGMADVFATRNPVILTAKPIKINVRPAAAENNGNWWLPAQNAELFAQFEPANPVFKAGEAVKRTIYLKVTGVVDTQLPELQFESAPGLKQYPEKPETQMKVENGKIVSIEKVENVYIPQQSGEMILPAIQLYWFNVKTEKMEKAALPPLKIEVLQGMTSATATAQPLPVSPNLQSGNTPAELPQTSAQESNIEKIEGIKPFYIYLLLGMAFAAGILVSMAIMRSLANKDRRRGKTNYKKEVTEAAENGDLRGLRDALIGWANEKYGCHTAKGLDDIEKLAQQPDFSYELEKLNTALYAEKKPEWDYHTFMKAFEKADSAKKRKFDDDEPLPKLYKN